MFRPGEIEGASLGVEGAFSELERRIMDDIVRRIRINGEITRSADWQLHRLHELGAGDAAVRAYIQDCLDYSDRQMTQLYYGVLRKGYYRDGSLYRGTGTDMIPFEENDNLQRLIEAVSQQTSGEMKNITQSLGFAVRQNGRLRFLPIADYYQRTLDGAMFDISSGAFDYNTVLKRVTKELTNSGLRTVDYASGRSIRVESAARMCVMTGFSQLTAKVNEQNADELGTEYFEVTWHGGARPEHQVWQGKVYTKEQLGTVCGLGAADGLCGCNCYHDYYPFIPGLSERAYTDEELEKLNSEENTPKEYHGKEYTAYEATQRQRALERNMRAQRQTIHLMQTGGADDEDVMLARGKYRALSAEYTNFSKAMGIPQQRERVTVDGLKNVGQGKYTIPGESNKTIQKNSTSGNVAKSNGNGIIISGSKDYNDVVNNLKSLGVSYNRVERHIIPPSEQRIIRRLGGGDRTNGSCTSLAFAYAGNKAGLNVLDFRGGDSCDFFTKNKNIEAITRLNGVQASIVRDTNDFKAVGTLVKNMKEGKEYILSTGAHTAVVRRTSSGKGYEYLELQDVSKNGFKPLNTSVLKDRFDCKKSHKSFGQTLQVRNFLFEVDSLCNSDEFKSILGYINTAKKDQQKGVGGYVK